MPARQEGRNSFRLFRRVWPVWLLQTQHKINNYGSTDYPRDFSTSSNAPIYATPSIAVYIRSPTAMLPLPSPSTTHQCDRINSTPHLRLCERASVISWKLCSPLFAERVRPHHLPPSPRLCTTRSTHGQTATGADIIELLRRTYAVFLVEARGRKHVPHQMVSSIADSKQLDGL